MGRSERKALRWSGAWAAVGVGLAWLGGCVVDPASPRSDECEDCAPRVDASRPPADAVLPPDAALPRDGTAAPDQRVFDAADPDGAPFDTGPEDVEAGLAECPEAQVAQPRLEARLNAVVALDGSASSDPVGAGLVYAWTVESRPEGSTAALVERYERPLQPEAGGAPDDPSTPVALFAPDVPGNYVFTLAVIDSTGRVSPGPGCRAPGSRVVLTARPIAAVEYELTWRVLEADRVVAGEGPDLDLHFRHPLATRWSDDPYACYYANTGPDWGQPGAPNDPRLAPDDNSGRTGEVLVLDTPEATEALGGIYRVGVHLYRARSFGAEDFGPIEVTLTVRFGGEIAQEITRTMEGTGHFWEVSGLHWIDGLGRVEPIDVFSRGGPPRE